MEETGNSNRKILTVIKVARHAERERELESGNLDSEKNKNEKARSKEEKKT